MNARNIVHLIGNLTRDPELSTTQNGINYCKFSIGVSRAVAKDAEKQSDFPSITCWRGTADSVCKYLHKGSKVCIAGNLQTGSYENKDGVKVYTTDVVAEAVEFLTPKSDEPAGASVTEMPKTIANMKPVDEDMPF